MNDITNLNQKLHFKNLNELRCIAVLLVIIYHVEQSKYSFGLANVLELKPFVTFGRIGVLLFFVLSGFLITFLLLKEKELTKTINIKYFYIRRMLRIWPLYYLINISALIIFPLFSSLDIPGINQLEIYNYLVLKTFLYIALMPNLVFSLFEAIPYASHTWTIGVEEQFYLLWPLVIKYVKNKFTFIICFIAIYLIIKNIFIHIPQTLIVNMIKKIIEYTPIDCLAIGGLFAMLHFYETAFIIKIKSFIFMPIVQGISILILIVFIGFGVVVPFFNHEAYALLFGILIYNLACNKKPLFSIENKGLAYLGKISYGIYMYHPLAIIITIKLLLFLNMNTSFLIYPFAILITIGVSTLSYKYIELPFIKKKEKFY